MVTDVGGDVVTVGCSIAMGWNASRSAPMETILVPIGATAKPKAGGLRRFIGALIRRCIRYCMKPVISSAWMTSVATSCSGDAGGDYDEETTASVIYRSCWRASCPASVAGAHVSGDMDA